MGHKWYNSGPWQSAFTPAAETPTGESMRLRDVNRGCSFACCKNDLLHAYFNAAFGRKHAQLAGP